MKESNKRRNKPSARKQAELNKARRASGTSAETKAVERGLDLADSENERNLRAWAATEKVLNSRARVHDVFDRVKD
jgi:hypothetical protein